MTPEKAIEWLEEHHFDLIFTISLMKPRWVVGDCQTTDEIAEGPTILEAVERAARELSTGGKS